MTTITTYVDINLRDYEVQLDIQDVLDEADVEDVLSALPDSSVIEYTFDNTDVDTLASAVIDMADGTVLDEVLRRAREDNPDLKEAILNELGVDDRPNPAEVAFVGIAGARTSARHIIVDGKAVGVMLIWATSAAVFRMYAGTSWDTGLVRCENEDIAQMLAEGIATSKAVHKEPADLTVTPAPVSAVAPIAGAAAETAVGAMS